MRMDNETYRLKVEGILAELRAQETPDEELWAEAERMALMHRKARHFLKALQTSGLPDETRHHFYRLIMEQTPAPESVSDLERHIRHSFYEAREQAKADLAAIAGESTLPFFFRVIAFTEEGWLAGELIRIVLAAPVDELREPLREALYSEDYLLQCLAIYLIGKLKDAGLLDMLARFYRKPEGEKIDRLEKKAYDALMEGMEAVDADLALRWLKDKSARIRSLGLTAVSRLKLTEAAADLVGLVLVDPRTRSQSAAVLLELVDEGKVRLEPGSGSEAIEKLVAGAKRPALVSAIKSLMREENPSVRQVAVELCRFIQPPTEDLIAPLRRLATDDHAGAVQSRALEALSELYRDRLVPVLVDVFAADGVAGSDSEVVATANRLMEELLTEKEVAQVQKGVEEKQKKRDAALDRFAASVEWWRHDM